MNCKKCEAQMEEDMKFCPNCGAAQNEPEVEELLTEALAEETPAEEEPAAKPGLGAGKIALLVVLGIAAIAVVVALLLSGRGGETPAETTAPTTGETQPVATIPADGNPDDVTCKGSYTVSDEEIAAAADDVVATMGDVQLTNAELQVYYWMGVYDFLNEYASYASMFGMDYSQPLDTQLSIDGTLTWQQYFLDSALDTWCNYQAMTLGAKEAEYVLTQEYLDYLEGLPEDLAESAAGMGYESAEAMIQRDMGVGAGMEDYLSYLETYYLGYMYYGETMESIELTDAEVEAYFDEHAAEYAANGLEKVDDYEVDVRHILISPADTTEEGWAAAEKEANDILNEWLANDPTEESFSALAQTHSVDGGSSSNGGLYEDVYVGQMVEEFNDWCFDESRQYGDYGIVKTTYGYHIMYFVERSAVTPPTWFQVAEEDMIVEKGNEFLQQMLDAHPAEIDYSAIKLGYVNLAATE